MNANFEPCLENYIRFWHQSSLQLQPQARLGVAAVFLRQQRYRKLKAILEDKREKWRHGESITDDCEFIDLIGTCLGLDAKAMRQEIRGDPEPCTREFISRARSLFPKLDDADLFQGLRNVWIMNVIQMIGSRPLELTDAMFAYSMLYPLSDNVLDDPQLDPEAKKSFVRQFGCRLKGERIRPQDEKEAAVFSMIRLIENQYERKNHPQIFQSLLYIHDAQHASLTQQQGMIRPARLLQLTFAKGATSVIADGYLVLGDLTPAQIDFLAGYGIVLQLFDDLQDWQEDQKKGHRTLFNTAKSKTERWQLTQKVMVLSEYVQQKLPCDNLLLRPHVQNLLCGSLKIIIGDALYDQKDHFPRSAVREINRLHPLGLQRHRKLRQCLAKRYPYELMEQKQSGYESSDRSGKHES